jgi:hypothetical protein
MRGKSLDNLDPGVRAAEKQLSRAADEVAISSGRKSIAQLKRENEVLAPLARDARIDLSAARCLG